MLNGSLILSSSVSQQAARSFLFNRIIIFLEQNCRRMSPNKKTIEGIRKREIKAFKYLFENFYASLCIFAQKYVNDDEAVLDIVQDAFIYFWEKEKDITSINSAKSYLYKTVRNKSLNYLRNSNKEANAYMEYFESELYFRDNIIEEETYQIIYNEIGVLPPQSQRVIEMSLDGLKNNEIAESLGISVNTVKTLKLRAFKSLRIKLKDHLFTLFIICHSQ